MRSAPRGRVRRTAAFRRRRSPFTGARQLADLADDEVLLQAAQPIDEHGAIEMIHLVLEAAGEQSRSLDDLLDTLAVESLEHRARRTGDRGVEAGHAQAAFFFELHAVAVDELGIDERHQILRVTADG